MNSTGDCKGCHTKRECDATLTHDQMRPDCPCNICLIKVVCNDSCDEYGNFWGIRGTYIESHMNANKGGYDTNR